MTPKTLAPSAAAATMLAFVDPFPAVVRGLFAVLGFATALLAAGHFARWTTPAPAQHLQHTGRPTPQARVPMPMFDGLNVQPPAPTPPPGIDPETGEVIKPADQPSSSAGTEPERPSPLPSPATNPPAAPADPLAAPAGLGTFVRWTKNGRDGLGQIVSIGTDEAEIRPMWPCATRQLTVPLHAITTIAPHELTEALS